MITVGFAAAGVTVHTARIETKAGVAIDRFEVTDTDGRKLDEDTRRAVREAIWSGTSSRAAEGGDVAGSFGATAAAPPDRHVGGQEFGAEDPDLGQAPLELERAEVVVAELGERCRRHAVGVVGECPFVELVPLDGWDARAREHLGDLTNGGPHDLQRGRALIPRLGREQLTERAGDPLGRGVRPRRAPARRVPRASGVPGVPTRRRCTHTTRDPPGQDTLDPFDDRGARRGESVARVSPTHRSRRQPVMPTRRSASAGSYTRPVTNGPNSAKRDETSSNRIS